MEILILRTFLTNIGNGFIDKGARMTVERAFPNANIIETSGYPLYAGGASNEKSIDTIVDTVNFIDQEERIPDDDNEFLHLAKLIDADVAILPGCTLYPRLLKWFIPVLKDLNKRDIPIIFLGAGGYFYTSGSDEVKIIKEYLKSISSCGIITRDKPAFNTFSNVFEYAEAGIDCAFFIDEWYTPPSSRERFHVHTFDNRDEPSLSTENEILRATHTPFGYSMPYKSTLSTLIGRYKTRGPLLNRPNLLLSDLLEDYLFLYANAEETHSDRVHACVPTLAYGNKAQFYRDTPRAALFEQISSKSIFRNPTDIPREKLENKKSEQVEYLKEAVNELA